MKVNFKSIGWTLVLISIFSDRPGRLQADVLTVDPISAESESSKIQWGPEFSLSLPQPLSVGAQLYCKGSSFFCHPNFKYFINLGYFRYPVFGTTGRPISLFTGATGIRYFPFSGSFYLSGVLGYRSLTFLTETSSFKIDDVTVSTAELRLFTFYFGPSFGWTFQLSSRLGLGFDFGLQLPILASGNLFLVDRNTGATSDTSVDLQVDSNVSMRRIASLIIPSVTLLRLIWNME